MSFYTSLSGLQASQTDMSVISHNIANVATTGFKKSRSEFADVIASNLASDPTKMVGSGAVVKANRQQFSEGNLQTTTSSLDLAIAGDGFFAVQTAGNNSTVAYTRNGSFQVDTTRNVVDAQGSHLLVYPVDSDGNATATGSDGLKNLVLPETSGTPVGTSKVALDVNLSSNSSMPTKAFDRTDATTYTNATATTVYDAAGNAMTLTNYFVRTTVPTDTDKSSTWQMYSYLGDQALTAGGASVEMKFDTKGVMTSPATTAIAFDEVQPPGSALSQKITLDIAGTSQLGSPFSVQARSQDGKAAGLLSGVTVDKMGLVIASFSNGDTQNLGKVALANFVNPTGLRQTGNSYWSSTGISGEAMLGSASENGYGSLMSGTLEGSNVDITEELVALIAAQRNFQANAKALDTASQISQTIFNIRS